MLKQTIIRKTLDEEPETRSNDRLLLVRVWEKQGMGFSESQKKFLLSKRSASPETVRRTRQKLRHEFPAPYRVETERQVAGDKHRRYHRKEHTPINQLFDDQEYIKKKDPWRDL